MFLLESILPECKIIESNEKIADRFLKNDFQNVIHNEEFHLKNYIISEIKCLFPSIITESTEVSLDK